jgi:hypothetical protein
MELGQIFEAFSVWSVYLNYVTQMRHLYKFDKFFIMKDNN